MDKAGWAYTIGCTTAHIFSGGGIQTGRSACGLKLVPPEPWNFTSEGDPGEHLGCGRCRRTKIAQTIPSEEDDWD